MLISDPYRGTPLGVDCAWPTPLTVRPLQETQMTIDLGRGMFYRVCKGAGKTVTALTGAVWITEQGSPRDVVLRAGETVRLARRGLALVEAFADARISVDPKSASAT